MARAVMIIGKDGNDDNNHNNYDNNLKTKK